jgi:hypothetical protein
MSKPIPRVISLEVVSATVLRVRFSDGTERTIDFEPVLFGRVYGPLREEALFRQVRIDSAGYGLEWPNGADFSPTTLHDWPDHVEAFARMTRGWEDSESRASR